MQVAIREENWPKSTSVHAAQTPIQTGEADDYDDRRLNELLFPSRPDYLASVPRPGLDFTEVHRQLEANRLVTLQLLWEEYREKQSGGYRFLGEPLRPPISTLASAWALMSPHSGCGPLPKMRGGSSRMRDECCFAASRDLPVPKRFSGQAWTIVVYV